jgi:hypothetical protein
VIPAPSADAAPVPEPGTLAAVAAVAGCAVLLRRLRQRKPAIELDRRRSK